LGCFIGKNETNGRTAQIILGCVDILFLLRNRCLFYIEGTACFCAETISCFCAEWTCDFVPKALRKLACGATTGTIGQQLRTLEECRRFPVSAAPVGAEMYFRCASCGEEATG
jgi:hypothetical protein